MAGKKCAEALGGRFEVEAFSRCPVICSGASCDLVRRHTGKIGFARQGAAHAQDSVFDTAFLPGCVRVAEEGLDAELVVKCEVLGELGAVIEGNGTSEFGRQGGRAGA